MTFNDYGRVAVGTPGTKVQVTANPDMVHRLCVAQVEGQTGKAYLYVQTNNGTLMKLRTFEAPTSTGLLDKDFFGGANGGNRVQVNSFWVDADNAGEGLYIYGEVT